MFCLGNPDRRGGLVLQEIHVRGGGLKSDPIRRGGADFFWNNPILHVHVTLHAFACSDKASLLRAC